VAGVKITNGGKDLSMAMRVEEWQAHLQRSEVNAAIREGLADIECGNYRPLDDFMEESFNRKGLPQQPLPFASSSAPRPSAVLKNSTTISSSDPLEGGSSRFSPCIQ
jgi:hypothetical protein